MENKKDKLDLEIKSSFKKAFDKKELQSEFYKNLEKKLEEEKLYEKSLKGRLRVFLNKEVEIDLRAVITAACILISLPTIFSIKEIGKEYKEMIQIQKILEKSEKDK